MRDFIRFYRVRCSPFGSLYSVYWTDLRGRKHVVRSFPTRERAELSARTLNDLSWADARARQATMSRLPRYA